MLKWEQQKKLKNDGHFWNPLPQISWKHDVNNWEQIVYLILKVNKNIANFGWSEAKTC